MRNASSYNLIRQDSPTKNVRTTIKTYRNYSKENLSQEMYGRIQHGKNYHPPQLGVIEALKPRESRFQQQPGFNPRSDTPSDRSKSRE